MKRSLGGRLSAWLALQSIFGLGLICGLIYLAVDFTLHERESETVGRKEQAVREQLSGMTAADQSEIAHRLGLMLAGHSDLGLQLIDRNGRELFQQDLPAHVQEDARSYYTFELPQGIRVILALDVSADRALLRRIAWVLLVIALLGAGATSLGGFWLVRYGLRPLHMLVAQTRDLGADTLERRLDGSAQPAELQPLIAQFNALLNRLTTAYAQMEAFNADVAHELNTPLATLISGSELALGKARNVEELREVLGSNLEELARLARIVADMLFLSRAFRGVGARLTQCDSLAVVAADVSEFHEAALQDAGLSLRIIGDAAGAVDTPLLQRALSNLIGNATRYAKQGSVVEVRIARRAPTQIEILVANEGPEIAPQHLPRVFDRCFRADPARHSSGEHHGLGLAIVDAIARLHGGGTMARSQRGRTQIGLWLTDPPPAMTAMSSSGSLD